MTHTQRRRTSPDTTAIRFLLDEFMDVPDGDDATTEAAASGVADLQAKAARFFLPGPRKMKGAYSPQQLGLIGLRASEFQQLRKDVRQWLRVLVTQPHVGNVRTLKGPLTLSLISAPGTQDRLRAPIVEGPPRDVFWFYLVHVLSRAGLTRIAVCRAPKSQRDPGQQNPELGGKTDPCGRLFLRRGRAKKYCSEKCRARVATQHARKGKR